MVDDEMLWSERKCRMTEETLLPISMVAVTSTLEISIPMFSQRQNDQQVDHCDNRGAPWSDTDLLGHTKGYLEIIVYQEG